MQALLVAIAVVGLVAAPAAAHHRPGHQGGGGNDRLTVSVTAAPAQSLVGDPVTLVADVFRDDDDPLSYAWDLDGDGAFDDSAEPRPTYTYDNPGRYTARLKVTDGFGESAAGSVVVEAGTNTPPEATIHDPSIAVT